MENITMTSATLIKRVRSSFPQAADRSLTVGDHPSAVYELESAVLCAGPPKDVATAHALLAAELVTLKNSPEARKHLAEAQRLDPENAEAKTIKIAP